ncbi:MAG: glycine oxidase ThiO [Acidimicrobiales bacterium]
MPDVLVLGGGIIGLAAAWRIAGSGASVTVLDDNPGSGATRAAAGMIAPVTEAHYGEEPLLELNLASASKWPAFAAELEQASGLPTGYDTSGTIAIGFDASDRAALDEFHLFHQSLGLESHRATASASRKLEPLLAPAISGGLVVPGDHQVDPRQVTAALLEACRLAGAQLLPARAAEIILDRDRFVGVRTATGERVDAGRAVLATGWRSGLVRGLPPYAVPPVRPVKGQVVRLCLPASLPSPSHTIRALVRGQWVYLVPRPGGEVVCGASVEELGEDTTVTAGTIYAILRDAVAVVPVIAEAIFTEVRAGLRPGSPDNAPLIGASAIDGLAIATGHFRHGVLLAPITAEIIAQVVSEDGARVESQWAAFDPRRFSEDGSR